MGQRRVAYCHYVRFALLTVPFGDEIGDVYAQTDALEIGQHNGSMTLTGVFDARVNERQR